MTSDERQYLSELIESIHNLSEAITEYKKHGIPIKVTTLFYGTSKDEVLRKRDVVINSIESVKKAERLLKFLGMSKNILESEMSRQMRVKIRRPKSLTSKIIKAMGGK